MSGRTGPGGLTGGLSPASAGALWGMGAVQGTSTFPALCRCWPGSIHTSQGAAFTFLDPVSRAFSSGSSPCVSAGCSFAGVNSVSSLALSFAGLVSSTALLLLVAHTHLHPVWHRAEAQSVRGSGCHCHAQGKQGEEKLWTRAPVKDDVSMRQFLGFATCCFSLHPSHPTFITSPHAPK